MGFTDRDWGDLGWTTKTGLSRRPRHVTPSAGTDFTAGPVAPSAPRMGDTWYDTVKGHMSVWNGADWLTVITTPPDGGLVRPTSPTSPPRPFLRPDAAVPAGGMVLVVDGSLTDELAREVEVVEAFKDRMERTAEIWADRHGYTIARGSWSTLPPVDRLVTVPLRLECFLAPRTDGEWPAIHAAVAEDAADRAFVTPMDQLPADGPYVVHIGPDAPPAHPAAPASPRTITGESIKITSMDGSTVTICPDPMGFTAP
jgi:hypothetical protein